MGKIGQLLLILLCRSREDFSLQATFQKYYFSMRTEDLIHVMFLEKQVMGKL